MKSSRHFLTAIFTDAPCPVWYFIIELQDQVLLVVFFTAGWANAIDLTEDIIPEIRRVKMHLF
jgi:hypothetical protein